MDPWAVAQAQVAAKYDPQQSAIDRQLASAKAGTVANEGAIQGFGNTGRGIIGETYGTLYGLLGNNQAKQKQELGQYAEMGDRGYDQALSQIGNQQQASRDYLSQMYAALGQSGQGYEIPKFTQAEDIFSTMNARATQAKTAYGGNFRDWAEKMNAISGEGINSAHQSEALRKSEFESQLLRALGENKLAGTTQETELMGRLNDIMGARGNDLIAMYNELAMQEWQRQMEQAKLDTQANLAAAQNASAERIAGMQEAGANARSAASNAAGSDLAMQKFPYEISQNEQNREDMLSGRAQSNSLERDKLAAANRQDPRYAPDSAFVVTDANGNSAFDWDSWNLYNQDPQNFGRNKAMATQQVDMSGVERGIANMNKGPGQSFDWGQVPKAANAFMVAPGLAAYTYGRKWFG